MVGNRKNIFIIATFLAITCLCGCGNSVKYKELSAPAISELDNTKYEFEKVKKGDIYKGITSVGKLVPVKKYSLAFNTNEAYIKSINVKKGDIVKKGQILAELDTDSLDDKINLQKILLEKSNLILENLTDSKAKETAIKSTQLDMEAGQLKLTSLQKELNDSKLISPVSGKILDCERVNAGDMVRMNQSVIIIADTGQMEIECIDEQVKKIRIGMKTKISYKGNEVNGEVVSLEEGIDHGRIIQIARISMEKLPKDAQLDDTANITVELGMKRNVLVIPKSCIKTTGGYPIVDLWENNSKSERFVELGAENDTEVEVISGLAEGDKIIKYK